MGQLAVAPMHVTGGSCAQGMLGRQHGAHLGSGIGIPGNGDEHGGAAAGLIVLHICSVTRSSKNCRFQQL
jgi:hypothetical protein